MPLAMELINPDAGTSPVALAFFTALFTAVSYGVVQIYKIRTEAREARDAALGAKVEARQAKVNTRTVGDGFPSRVDRKLDKLSEHVVTLETALREHIEYHLEQENKHGHERQADQRERQADRAADAAERRRQHPYR